VERRERKKQTPNVEWKREHRTTDDKQIDLPLDVCPPSGLSSAIRRPASA